MFIIDKKLKSWFQKKPASFLEDINYKNDWFWHWFYKYNSLNNFFSTYFHNETILKSFSFSEMIMTSCWYIYSQTLVFSNNSMVLGRKTNNKQNNIPFLFHYHCTNNSHLLINVCQFVFKHTKSKRLCFKVFDERFDCTICILRFLQLSHSPSNPTLWIIYEFTIFYIGIYEIWKMKVFFLSTLSHTVLPHIIIQSEFIYVVACKCNIAMLRWKFRRETLPVTLVTSGKPL